MPSDLLVNMNSVERRVNGTDFQIDRSKKLLTGTFLRIYIRYEDGHLFSLDLSCGFDEQLNYFSEPIMNILTFKVYDQNF